MTNRDFLFLGNKVIGLTFGGYVKVPQGNHYAFGLGSDDGSKLLISDSLVVDNDGPTGGGDIAGEEAQSDSQILNRYWSFMKYCLDVCFQTEWLSGWLDNCAISCVEPT